ncbi:MAG TPA: hypothetical protein PLP21_10990 [Pyrinomonadaceae bacterium]|nr:hypothetical protein [Acidobacteriota bacterium]HQZ96833.1 hypothetical protein [Pyrinomonadaceae bacterium]
MFVFFSTLSFRPVVLLIAITGLVFVTASCGGPAERIREKSVVQASPSPTPGEREISGVFNVEGSAENGNNPYTGVLTIQPQGDAYGFRWTTTKGTRVGTGVQIGNATAASFAATGGGQGCGVVLYKIASDGSLTGRIGLWGEGKYATETAIRVEGRSFVGKYSVKGTSPDGKPYQGTLAIVKDGSGYDLTWSLPEPRLAFGIWKGSVAAASFGGRQCSFALYDVQSNGNLDGNWGGQAAVTFGTETAKSR